MYQFRSQSTEKVNSDHDFGINQPSENVEKTHLRPWVLSFSDDDEPLENLKSPSPQRTSANIGQSPKPRILSFSDDDDFIDEPTNSSHNDNKISEVNVPGLWFLYI